MELYFGLYKLKYLNKDFSKSKFNRLSLDLKELIEELSCFNLDLNSANLGANFSMKLKGEGQEVEIFDCLIASIIISNDYNERTTTNWKHFERFESLELIDF